MKEKQVFRWVLKNWKGIVVEILQLLLYAELELCGLAGVWLQVADSRKETVNVTYVSVFHCFFPISPVEPQNWFSAILPTCRGNTIPELVATGSAKIVPS